VQRYLPNTERLSVISATILLAYALARFIQMPALDLGVQLPGFYLSVSLSVQAVVAFLVALLTAAGAAWLLHDHPALRRGQALEHWLLPALTAWALGVPLFQMPLQPIWWVGFGLGGLMLILVLVAEYAVVDENDARRPLAAAGLTAVAFALYLVLAAGLRFAGLRLFLLLPTLGGACLLVSLRVLRLRRPQSWQGLAAGLTALISVQMAAALHYWSLPPVTFGLALLGPAYALTTYLGSLAEGQEPRQAWIEPAVVLAVLWGAALWIR
jgi:hypothetical protein